MSDEHSAWERSLRLRENLAAMVRGFLARRVAQVAAAANAAPEAGSKAPTSSVDDFANVPSYGSAAACPKKQRLPQDACIEFSRTLCGAE